MLISLSRAPRDREMCFKACILVMPIVNTGTVTLAKRYRHCTSDDKHPAPGIWFAEHELEYSLGPALPGIGETLQVAADCPDPLHALRPAKTVYGAARISLARPCSVFWIGDGPESGSVAPVISQLH